jgi:arginine utilization protein RocB
MIKNKMVTMAAELYDKLHQRLEFQEETIELLTAQLRNERLKNGNLDALVRTSRTNLDKTVED